MKLLSSKKGLETLEWVLVGVALCIVAYGAYTILGGSISANIKGLSGMI
jgi:hypothetical protein